MNGSIIEEKDGYTVEHIAHTYSEEENQQRKMNKANSESVYSPEFIPFYCQEVKSFGLTINEGLIYGFIRFYTKNGKGKFFFNSTQFAEIVGCSKGSIDNAISKFKKLGIIDTGRRVKAGGGTIRYIKKVYSVDHLIAEGVLTSLTDKLHTKKNNINKNKKYTVPIETDSSFLFSKLKNSYGLDKTYIEQAFEKKKTLHDIESICYYIYHLSSMLGLDPIYDKRTINCFDIIRKHYSIDGLVEQLVYYDYVSEEGVLASYIDTLHDVVEADYYLPCVLEIIDCN